MQLVGLTIARNESWCIGLTGRAALMYCDEWVVLDHASTDKTAAILLDIAEEHPGRVTILNEESKVWEEMRHRQRTLIAARARKATHCAIVDADEILCGDLLPDIKQRIKQLPPGAFMGIPMRNLHRSINRYRSDNGIWGMRTGTMLAFADSPLLCWVRRGGYDHHQRSPLNSRMGIRLGGHSGIMHLQFAVWRRLLAKHALYQMMERLKYPSKPVREIRKLYTMAPDETGAETSPCPPEWWAPYKHLMKHLYVKAEPWQVSECRRLWAIYGAEAFAGLELFGIVGEKPEVGYRPEAELMQELPPDEQTTAEPAVAPFVSVLAKGTP